jgi:hypothetical protein
MNQACARSWGTQSDGWFWCTLSAGHEGPCCCDGRIKPEGVKYFEEQPEAAAFIEKQTADYLKIEARKHRLI